MDPPATHAPSRKARSGGFEAAWRERFEEFATDHDDDAGIAGWSETGLAARVRRFTGVWQVAERPGTWLDVGCGAGTYLRWLREQGCAVVGVDYSQATLIKTATRMPGVPLAAADVRALPFRAGQFDGAICFGVTQALSSSEMAIAQLAACVREGGELWIDALNRRCLVHAIGLLRRRAAGQPIHLRYEDPRELATLMRAQGMTDVAIVWMPIVPARWLRLQRLVESASARRLFAAWPWLAAFASHSFIVRGRKRAHSQP
jgi:SAM-dependent methyltransferase